MTLLALVGAAYALSLEEAWQLALHEGADAALLRRQADAAATVRGQAVSALLPRVALSGSYTINERETVLDFAAMLPEELQGFTEGSEPVVINEKMYSSASVSVVQPLFSGGALPAWGAAQATARAAEAQAEAGLDQLRVGVTTAYWAAWLSRERARLAGEGVTRAESYLQMAETRERLGAGRGIDTVQAAVALARARRELAQTEASRAEAEHGLARLLGVAPDVALSRPVVAELPFANAEEVAAGAGSTPAIVSAEERARAARQVRTATDLGWLPSLSARFTEAYSGNAGFSGEPWNWQVAIAADWPVFDGGYRIAKEREAAANADVARLAADRTRDLALAEARTAWARVAAASEARTLSLAELALAEQAARVAEASYALGSITFLDLWQTRQQRDAAELGSLAAEMTLDLAGVGLRAATGGW